MHADAAMKNLTNIQIIMHAQHMHDKMCYRGKTYL